MNYELAKKLKDAGFPQNDWGVWIWNGEGTERCSAPTLSELIEACGDIFYGLQRVGGEWMAFIYDIEDSTRQLEVRGKTPEEAVVNLLLALKHGD